MLAEDVNGAAVLREAHCLVCAFWRSEVPVDQLTAWREPILFSAKKGRGDYQNLDNQRGIVLVNLVSKLVSRLLNDKLTATVDAGCADSEVGFRAGRGVAEGVFVVRRLAEAYNGSPRQLIPSLVLTMRSISPIRRSP